VCLQQCPETDKVVCANDGQTYANDCEMRRQSCSQGIELEVVHAGECEDVRGSTGRCIGVFTQLREDEPEGLGIYRQSKRGYKDLPAVEGG